MFGLGLGKLGGAVRAAGFVPAFSPLSLFANGEQGAWYDPSDLSTMFQDSAGTIPVTADGQPVGLILDKSKGLALGPELVTNGDFASASSWLLHDASMTISGGALRFTATPTLEYVRQIIGATRGQFCEITIAVTSVSSGSLNVQFDLGYGASISTMTAAGTYTFRFRQAAEHSSFYIQCVGITTAVVESVSVKIVSGNHASQSTSTARPLYKTDGTYHWLQFDGVDDSLSTGAVDFSVTDKVTVSVGCVNNNSTTGMLFCSGDDPLTVNGTFGAYTGVVANGDYSIGARGQAQCYLITGSGAIPRKDVVSLLYNLSQVSPYESLKVRLNSEAVALTLGGGGSLGGGLFSSQSLYIGRRGIDGFYLNGNIYALIIRGASSTTQEITDTETWVNGKTGAY